MTSYGYGGIDTLIYENTAAFIQHLVTPEPPYPSWMNQVIYAGLFDDVSPKTIWAAKRLQELCNSPTKTSS